MASLFDSFGVNQSQRQENAERGRLQSAFRRAIREAKRRNNPSEVLRLEQQAAQQGVNRQGIRNRASRLADIDNRLGQKSGLLQRFGNQQRVGQGGVGFGGPSQPTSSSSSASTFGFDRSKPALDNMVDEDDAIIPEDELSQSSSSSSTSFSFDPTKSNFENTSNRLKATGGMIVGGREYDSEEDFFNINKGRKKPLPRQFGFSQRNDFNTSRF